MTVRELQRDTVPPDGEGYVDCEAVREDRDVADRLRVPLEDAVVVCDCERLAVKLGVSVEQVLGEAVSEEETDSVEQALGEADKD